MMKDVPIYQDVDLLVAGGSTAAILAALRAKAAGRSVFLGCAGSALGEETCATLEPLDPENPLVARHFPHWREHMPSPMEIARALERLLLESEIPFLYQVIPMAPVADGAGNAVGALFASRGGPFLIRARGIVDGSPRHSLARRTAMPFAPFVPGPRTVTRISLAPEGVTLAGEMLPVPAMVRGKIFRAFRRSETLRLDGIDPSSMARLEASMRERCSDAAAEFTADLSVFEVGDGPMGEDPAGSLWVPERFGEEALERLKARVGLGAPVRLLGLDPTPGDSQRFTHFSTAPRLETLPRCDLISDPFPVWGRYDVAVVGGGTAGAAAVIGAAREGARAVALEQLHQLGGVGTEGRIAVYWYGNRVGFTAEVDRGVAKRGTGGEQLAKKGRWNVEWKQQYWLETVRESGAEAWFGQVLAGVRKEGDRVVAILCAGPQGAGWIEAKAFIDASGSADLAAAAGAPTVRVGGDEPASQGVGLSPKVPGAHYENSDYTFTDDEDPLDRTRAFVAGRAALSGEFDLGRIINSRERRRIQGDFTVQPMDLLLRRRYRDTITLARSNFDTHGFSVHPIFLLRPPNHDALEARVPYRALLPQGLHNVLAVGLGISAHRDAMPVIRMQPDVQNQGYAAGLAAALAARSGIGMRDVSLDALQKKLVSLGILGEDERLAEDEPIPPMEQASDPLAAAFADPATSIPILRARYRESGKLEDALLLAFLGVADGREAIEQRLREGTWDQGWAYKGMGQFGACLSPMDAAIMALAQITGEKDGSEVLSLMDLLTPEDAFSHFRACARFFIQHPTPDAAPGLRRLLAMPGMRGHAQRDLVDLAGRKATGTVEDGERNRQLKELYLSHALFCCAPEDVEAKAILGEYARGVQGLYARFAKGVLAKAA